MGTGYTRNDTPNNIADGNVINASDLDGEFDAIQSAFNGSTGHSHDGTTGEGPQIATAGLADNAVTTAKITDANVTTAKIADANVTLAKMAANSVDSDQYVDGSIDTAHIADDAVTSAKLDTNIQIAGTLGVTGETTLTTHLNMGDNDTIKLGNSADLQIYHDPANGNRSVIKESGGGSLHILATNLIVENTTDSKTSAQFIDGGAVELYHNSVKKFETTSSGIDVTGTATMDGLTVDGDITLNDNSPTIIFDDANGVDQNFTFAVNGGTANIQSRTDAGVNTTRLTISTNGDISFNEDTGTTPKLFWDASAEGLGIGTTSVGANALIVEGGTSYFKDHVYVAGGLNKMLSSDSGSNPLLFGINLVEKMRITSTGNVGIGTSSPTYKIESSGSSNTLKLVNGTTYDLRFVEQNSLSNIYSYGSLDLSINTRYSNNIRFKTNDTERMRIDNSGNVGIGTSSPAGQLHVNAANPNVYITCADTGQSDIMFGGTSDSDAGIIRYADNDDSFRFFTDNSERMRIDSSGNLLVGTTDSNLTDNTTGSGIVAQANGALVVAREANTPFYVNRTGTSDGTLVDFRADGGTVGSIGTNGGNLIVQGSTATGKTGIKFGGAEWIPQDTGANSDGGVDLGGSSYRFKDLYLSGGVYLGGTGSANFLDDYEEGAFDITITPETSGSITVTTGFNSLIYTKIGRIVHITGAVGLIGVSSPVGTYVTIAGLPFTIASLDEIQEYAGFATYYIDDSTSSRSLLPSLYFTGTSFRAYIDASTIQANDTFAFNFSYIAT